MYSTRAFCKKRPEFGHCVSQRHNVIMLWRNITSWRHVHGDGCLQTPVVYDYSFYLWSERHQVLRNETVTSLHDNPTETNQSRSEHVITNTNAINHLLFKNCLFPLKYDWNVKFKEIKNAFTFPGDIIVIFS